MPKKTTPKKQTATAGKAGRNKVTTNYNDVIQKIMRDNDGYGFVDYRTARYLARDFNKLIDTAFDFVKKKNFDEALSLAMPLLRRLIRIITDCDDSDNNLGSTIDRCIKLIETIAGYKKADNKLKNKLFDFVCAELTDDDYYSYADWGNQLFNVLRQLTISLDNQKQFFEFIKNRIANPPDDFDLAERLEGFLITQKISYLHDIGKLAEAEATVDDNMHLLDVRHVAAETALSKKDYKKVKALVTEGLN